jgi:hypothetical protein
MYPKNVFEKCIRKIVREKIVREKMGGGRV